MIYEYTCRKCKEVFEEQRKMSERHDPIACQCGGQGDFKLSTPKFKTCGGGHGGEMK